MLKDRNGSKNYHFYENGGKMNILLGYEHNSFDPFVFGIDEKNVEIRFKAPASRTKEVKLSYGDPYLWRNTDQKDVMIWVDGQYKQMQLIGTDGIYDWFSSIISVSTKRLAYSFEVEDIDGNTIIVDETGVYKHVGEITHDFNLAAKFNFPYFFNDNVFAKPKWTNETVWYQIFPDRFKRGKNYNSGLEWHYGRVHNDESYGGNLEGVIESLDYLSELGVNGIYFTPMFKAGTSHKYDTEDYYLIDPDFGTLETFKMLIDEAHKRGIKVMLDAVFNHSSSQHELFQDVIKNKENSQYFNWFKINDVQNLDNYDKYRHENFMDNYLYESFGFEPLMPKLNTENPEVIDYFKKVVNYWTNLGVDAWRFDVANELSHYFIKEIRKEILSVNCDCYIIGEIWHDAQNWLKGDEFHATMNYTYTGAMIDYFAKNKISKEQLKNRLLQTEMKYNTNVCQCAFNVVDTHDTERILYTCGEDKNKLRFLATFLFTQKGSPCIYYGTEIGMTGDGIGLNNNRKCMVWDDELQDKELLSFYRDLVSFRKENGKSLNISQLKICDTPYFSYQLVNEVCNFEVILNDTNDIIEVESANVILSYNYSNNKLEVGGIVIIKK